MKTRSQLNIDAYINQHPDAKLAGPLQVVVHGKNRALDVFRLPTKFLIFNIGNGRFASELLAEEERIGRKLDATRREDAKIIKRFLLEQNEDETKALKEDLKKNGQLDPGIITVDGAVINGNRRTAILQVLFEETGDEKYEYLNVGRLPKGVDEKDLWRIEAKLQFGRDFRLEYGPVNELLKIRTGRESGLTAKQISQALVGRYSEKQVEDKLRVLKLIESYLQFIGKPGQYKTIQEDRVSEHFNSLQSSVVAPLLKSGLRAEVPKVTQVAFAMIQGGKHSHWKIRDLREITEFDKARRKLYRVFGKAGKITSNRDQINDAFDGAQTEVDTRKEHDRPEKLAEKAISALKGIDSNHASLKKPALRKLLADVQNEVERLLGVGGKGAKKGR